MSVEQVLMNANKPTPGPWVWHPAANDAPGGTVKAQSGRKAHPDDDGIRPVAYVLSCVRLSAPFREEMANIAANGRLIAAAPDLLAACEAIRWHLSDDFPDGPDSDNGDPDKYRAAYRAVCDALVKVEETPS